MKDIDLNKVVQVCKQLDILKKSRKREIVYQRYAAYNYLHVNTKLPYRAIGELIGGKDHATVMSGLKVYSTFTELKDSVFLWTIKEIEGKLNTCEKINFTKIRRGLSATKRINYFNSKYLQQKSYNVDEVNLMFNSLKENSIDNVATITNVDLFISSWKRQFKK